MLQTHGNRWKWQRLETEMRSDPERSKRWRLLPGERSAALRAPLLTPERRQSKTCQLAQSLVGGGKWQPGSWETCGGGCFNAIASYGPFAYFHRLRSSLVSGGKKAALTWLLIDGLLGQSPHCCRGKQKQAGVKPWPLLASLPNTAEIPICCTWKAATNHCSGWFSVSVSVVFTFSDLWIMKYFLEDRIPFEMHILKALHSINGLVFLSYLSQTP